MPRCVDLCIQTVLTMSTLYSRGADFYKRPKKWVTQHPHHTKGLKTDSDSQIPTDHLFDIRIYKLWGQWLGTLRFLRGVGGILKHQISAFSHRVKTLKNHIFLLNQANGLVFGQRVLIHKSYNLRCILCLFCVAMVTVYKETLSMGSNVNNNGCFDFRDKYTLPIYLECAYNWYLLILENCLYEIFCKIANQTIALSCNESWKLS